MNRRAYLKGIIAVVLAVFMSGCSGVPTVVLDDTPPQPTPLMGNRFLTLSIPIRTTPWEVSRDVKLIDLDESDLHTLKNVRALREAFHRGCPDGRLTWSFTLNAMEDQRTNYKEIRDYVVQCQKEYGDEVSYFPGYFPAMYLPRERVNREMTEAISLISKMVGGGYRPQSIIGGFLSAENMKYLSEVENIHVAHGVIWSQQGVDAGGADGSISYPYYPSKEHLCKPAQNKADFIDCVNLDGWTMDFVCAQQVGGSGHGMSDFNSRRGMGPIETYGGLGLEIGHKEVMHTQSVHFDRGFELNGFAWVTSIWEAVLIEQYPPDKYEPDLIVKAMEKWISDTMKRWPNTKIVSFGEFGEIWRNHYKSNDKLDYRFEAQGSGIADSKADTHIRWFMNKAFRLALISNSSDSADSKETELVMDFTRYDLPAKEPADPTPENPTRNWGLVNRISQKNLRPQDKRIPLTDLTIEDKKLIFSYYPELFSQ